jgi:hypothetical protein
MASDEQRVGIGGVRVPEYLRPSYANYVNVNHTPWDFRLMFALVKTPMPGDEEARIRAEAEGEAPQLHPEAVAEVVIPANLMHGLIAALQENFSTYMNQFGPPGMDPEGPRTQEE